MKKQQTRLHDKGDVSHCGKIKHGFRVQKMHEVIIFIKIST